MSAEKIAAAQRHLDAGEDAEARTALQAAAAHEPEPLPGTLLAMGDSYARAGRWGEAQASYAEATRRFPYVAAGWAGLGRAQRGAIADWRRWRRVPGPWRCSRGIGRPGR